MICFFIGLGALILLITLIILEINGVIKLKEWIIDTVFSIVIIGFGFSISGGFSALSADLGTGPEYESRVTEMLEDREEVMSQIDETKITKDILKEIRRYNRNVNVSNNYWWRFKLQDRSQFEIDYDYYLALYEAQQEKLIEEKLK